jgi:ribonucleoside-diphosphate reductase alpha chain
MKSVAQFCLLPLLAQSMMDYILRRLALDYLPFQTRSAMGLYT